MLQEAGPSRMGKRAALEINGQTLRRVPVFELEDGEREVPVPMSRLKNLSDPVDLPDFATVIHSGYTYEAELIPDEEEPVYVFDVEHY